MLYERDVFQKIKKVLPREEFVVLTGPRQAGKTTLLIMLKAYLENQGQLCHYFNLENPQYLDLLNNHPFNIFDIIPNLKARQNIFIDEIQYLDDPTNFMKLLYDEKRSRLKIIASGSSAFYIDEKFKDSLAGRKFLFEIFPLNFDEFLVFNRRHELLLKKGKRISAYYKDILSGLWERYLVYGGYPKVVLAEDDDMRKILLEELGASYIKKEAKEAGIKNTGKYFSLLKILAEQIDSLVNSQGLANTLKIAHKTIDEYFYVMKKSYQVAFIRPFYRSLRKELTKMPKVYFYDTGLRNFFVDDFNLLGRRRDKGAFLENIAFRELSIQAGSPEKIKFWRTQDKNEVDFIAGGEAFEIKFDQGRLRRNNYREFTSRYPDIKLTFLTYKDILERFYGYRIV